MTIPTFDATLVRALDAARRYSTSAQILLVEQNVELALNIADRAYVIDQGVIVQEATGAALLADADIQERYCSV